MPPLLEKIAEAIPSSRGNASDRKLYVETNTEPSEAQTTAGNYKKAKIRWNGLILVIENPKGSTRRGVSADGKPWANLMKHHYGYFRSD